MVRVYIPVAVERSIRAAARNRCGYCLSPQHLLMARLEIEHIVPRSKGGPTENGLRVVGLTPVGRATVAALHLSDDPDVLEVRSYWVIAGLHPPKD
jgi:hypothetical protein